MTEYSGERLLIFAPHADDAEFGMGGWLSRMKEEGVGTARIIIAATGSYLRSDGLEVHAAVRRQEMLAAAQCLGIEFADVIFARWFQENRAPEAKFGELVQLIADEIDKYNPTEVFVCLPSFNQDHTVMYNAVITAMRPGQHKQVKNLWAYPYPGTCWGPKPPDSGRCYIKLKQAHVDAKLKALRCHVTQFMGRDVAVGPQAALVNMMQYGAEVGEEYAELLYLLREIF